MRLRQILGGCDLHSSLSLPSGHCSVGDDPDFLPFMNMGGTGTGDTPNKKPVYTPPDPKFDDHPTKEDQVDDSGSGFTSPAVPAPEHQLQT